MVLDDDISSDPLDQYLLRVSFSDSPIIDCRNLIIDTSDMSRFDSVHQTFIFSDPLLTAARILLNEGMEYMLSEDYQQAEQAMRTLISTYPTTGEARTALLYLPFVKKAVSDGYEDLIEFLNSIDAPNLEKSVMQAKALAYMFYEEYQTAYDMYETIIVSLLPGSYEYYIISLNMRYCTYQMSLRGTRTETAVSLNNYLLAQKEIYAQIDELILKGRGIDDEPIVDVPEIIEFGVNNYPNPFNPETVISFALPADSQVSLIIYNIKGQKVRSLINENYKRGHHKVVWNGRDENGSSVASGIYFYRIQTSENSAVKKMLLLK
jgi:tetratricopeptide (TPR) repeat protein